MNTKFIIGILLGVVIAVGGTVYAVEESSSLKDFVIGLGAKVLELESRVNEFSFAIKNKADEISEDVLGGISNLDILNYNWLQGGPKATTTASEIYHSKIHLQSTQNSQVAVDYWRNDTGVPVWVTLDNFYFKGTASSSFYVGVATSTRQADALTDAFSVLKIANAGSASSTGASTYPYNTNGGVTQYFVRMLIATSTPTFILGDEMQVGSTTVPRLIAPGEYVNLVVTDASLQATPNDRCVGNNDTTAIGASGKCEAATSTARGFDIDVWFDVSATTTPKEDTTL